MNVKISDEARLVIERLENSGHEGWCVGGCVRDSLLGREPNDWDVTTDATPEELKEIFRDFRTLDTGIAHGTVTVICGDVSIEVTTYRADGEYRDHRHPVAVRFSTSIADDLCRRDFTVNAMAYHPVRGLCDPFSGRVDLERKILRCVGEPERRFEEDALRILRCLRFAATLGFEIEAETARAVREKRELLSFVSTERIREELFKLLCGQNAERISGEYRDVLRPLLPSLLPMSNRRARVLLRELGMEGFTRFLASVEQTVGGQQKEIDKLLRLAENETQLQITDLAVSGKDLLELGFAPGRELGECLNELLSEVRAGRLENEREKLLERVRLLWEKNDLSLGSPIVGELSETSVED